MSTVWSAIYPRRLRLILSRKISSLIREQVCQRARHLCEYCHTDERWQLVPFTIDHIIPVSQGGNDDLANLALACFHCNRRKSNKQFVISKLPPETSEIFNPRQMKWAEHFVWSSDALNIIALTKIGSATVQLLDLNRARILRLRQADYQVNRHPPNDDPIQLIN